MLRNPVLILTLVASFFVIPNALAEFPDDWDRIDTQVFHRGKSNAETVFPLDRRYERVAFISRDGGTQCQFVRIVFGNGTVQLIEDQRFRVNRERRVNLDGDERHVSHVRFRCRSRVDGPTRLIVYAR